MKAIDTEYNGYKFRSRLEARWAVFFDTLGVKYEYEPQGFEFDDGTRYLPDFWLPEHKVWVEIKPSEPSDDERRKAYLLSCGHKSPVMITFGGVGLHTRDLGEFGKWKFPNHQMELFCGDFWDTFDCPSHFMQWVESTRFESLSEFLSEQYGEPFVFDGSRESMERMIEADKRYFANKYGKEHWAYKWGRHMSKSKLYLRYDNRTGVYGDIESICTFSKDEIAAHNAASTARFEFGETPKAQSRIRFSSARGVLPCPKCNCEPLVCRDQNHSTFCIYVMCGNCGLTGPTDDSSGGAKSLWNIAAENGTL